MISNSTLPLFLNVKFQIFSLVQLVSVIPQSRPSLAVPCFFLIYSHKFFRHDLSPQLSFFQEIIHLYRSLTATYRTKFFNLKSSELHINRCNWLALNEYLNFTLYLKLVADLLNYCITNVTYSDKKTIINGRYRN